MPFTERVRSFFGWRAMGMDEEEEAVSDVSIQTQPRKDRVLAGKNPISERERGSQN